MEVVDVCERKEEFVLNIADAALSRRLVLLHLSGQGREISLNLPHNKIKSFNSIIELIIE